jgi:hypothetical protein
MVRTSCQKVRQPAVEKKMKSEPLILQIERKDGDNGRGYRRMESID